MNGPGTHFAEIIDRGYTVMEGAVSPDVVAAFRSELQPFLHSGPFGRNDFEGYRSKRVYALLAKTPSVAAMVEHPDVLALLEDVAGVEELYGMRRVLLLQLREQVVNLLLALP